MSATPTNKATRTLDQLIADKMDCELDNFVRRTLNQAIREPSARKHWEKIAKELDNVRGLIRQRMHEDDRKATS